MKKKILFIVNPISGGKNKKRIPELINKHLSKAKFEYRISFTERVEHGYMLAKAAVKDGFEIIVAVGGDGTVNEVAKALIKTDIILGIIPFGSGNGLARSLKIPLNISKAIAIINDLQTDLIDAASFNEDYFFNVAGTGFDAHISQSFATNKTRGLFGYVGTTFKEMRSYIPLTYKINLDGKEITRKAFILSVANSAQYGNGAYIAPRADVKDGLLDVIVVKPIAWYNLPFAASKMFTKKVESSRYVEIFQAKKIIIERDMAAPIHLDGEPKMGDKIISVEVIPLAIKVIVPSYV